MPSGRNLLRLVASALAPGMGSVLAGKPWRGIVLYLTFLILRRYTFRSVMLYSDLTFGFGNFLSDFLPLSLLIWLTFMLVDVWQAIREMQSKVNSSTTISVHLFTNIGLVSALLVLLLEPLHIGLTIITISSMLVGCWLLAGVQIPRASLVGFGILVGVIVLADFSSPDPGVVACRHVRDSCANSPHSFHSCFLTYPIKVIRNEAAIGVVSGGDCHVYVPGGSPNCSPFLSFFSVSYLSVNSLFSYPTFFHPSSRLGNQFIEPVLESILPDSSDFEPVGGDPGVMDTMYHTVCLQRENNRWKVVSCGYEP